ncbi:metalloendoproteinase 3-MMP-like [Impatiens glandulifera]|uniref:metalloendoproteinase 3-MMP-like n=1 Tax=Impatiens glandulifera TaxID=253017 RepID=UPI001FB16B96|nr:metalloendoproteinase 3-MMP-like [Impatiens glandulifera]
MLLLVFANPTMQASHKQSNNSTSMFVQSLLNSKKGDEVMGLHRIKQYLVKYGYLSPSHVHTDTNNEGNFDDALEEAVKKYQVFFHLNVSGVLDSKTLSLMDTSRCGNSDHTHVEKYQHHFHGTNITNSFYLPSNKKWNKISLSYAIQSGTRSDVIAQIWIALATWDMVSPLTFVDRSNDFSNADLKFSFFQREHGDGHPFDGPGKVLAHAFYPPNGEIHFDADENLVVGEVPDGIDISSLALHELGHAIGLVHSNIESSIMWPYMSPGIVKGLHIDDVHAIRALYPL